MQTTELEIAGFLSRMKGLVTSGKNIIFADRKKNREALIKYNLTVKMVWKILLGLTSGNYSKGPEADRDGTPGEVWVFVHPVTGQKMYIKLKLFRIGEDDYLKVLSFHD